MIGSSVIKAGMLFKRGERTSFLARRWVEIKPGFILWYRLQGMSRHAPTSCRFLPGCSFEPVSHQGSTYVGTITIYVCAAPGVKASPIVFKVELEQEFEAWLQAIQRAANWQNYRKILPPIRGSRDRLCGLLVIEMVAGEGLMVADWGGTSDPYTIVEFDGCYARTKTIFKTLCPEWNEVLTIPVFHDDPNWLVSFYCYDADEVSADDLLGIVSLPLFSLGRNREKIWRLPLRPERRTNDKVDLGCITVRTFYHTSAFVEALPLEDRHLQPSSTHQVDRFSVDLFKVQIDRLNKIRQIFLTVGALSEILNWRRPNVSAVTYVVLSVLILVVPRYLFTVALAVFGFSLLMHHPEYHNIYKRIFRPFGLRILEGPSGHRKAVDRGRMNVPSPRSSQSIKLSKSSVRIQEAPSEAEMTDDSSEDELIREENIIRVWECERRNVGATAGVLLSRDVVQGSMSVFKKTFSHKNLQPTEPRWFEYTGSEPLPEAPKTVDRGFKYSWRVRVDPSETDVNGWEYARSFPSKSNWMAKKFRKGFLVHMHWVRRRLWVGVPVREAGDEDAVRSIDEVGGEEEDDDVKADSAAGAKGILARYRKLLSEGSKIQGKLFHAAGTLEKILNRGTWKNPRATGLIFIATCIGIVVTVLIPPLVLIWMIASGIFLSSFIKYRKRLARVNAFIKVFKSHVYADKRIAPEWGRILVQAEPSTTIQELSEVNPDVLRALMQRTCDDLKMSGKKVSLDVFNDCINFREMVEAVHLQVLGKNWMISKRRLLILNPGVLINQHGVGDWERFDYYSHLRVN